MPDTAAWACQAGRSGRRDTAAAPSATPGRGGCTGTGPARSSAIRSRPPSPGSTGPGRWRSATGRDTGRRAKAPCLGRTARSRPRPTTRATPPGRPSSNSGSNAGHASTARPSPDRATPPPNAAAEMPIGCAMNSFRVLHCRHSPFPLQHPPHPCPRHIPRKASTTASRPAWPLAAQASKPMASAVHAP